MQKRNFHLAIDDDPAFDRVVVYFNFEGPRGPENIRLR